MSAGFYTSIFWIVVFFGLFLAGYMPDQARMKARIKRKAEAEAEAEDE